MRSSRSRCSPIRRQFAFSQWPTSTGKWQGSSTPTILRTYDPNFDNHFIYETYLTTLLQAWLDDIAHHWKSTEPPGVKDLPQELARLIAA